MQIKRLWQTDPENQHYYNKLIQMFKPTLKRSKQSETYLFQSQKNLITKSSFIHDREQLINKTFNTDLYVPALFSKSLVVPPPPREKRVISPFNHWDFQYPSDVKAKMNIAVNRASSRLVGSKYGIFWLVTENQMQIWRYQSEENPTTLAVHRKLELQKNIRAVSMGHLDREQCPLLNLKENCEIMAIGFDHIIDVYVIDLTSLELRSTDIRFKVENNETLQKLEITDKNQILFTGEQGYLTKVSFNTYSYLGFPKINQYHARPSIFRRTSIIPSIELSKTKTRVFTERILTTNKDKIYVLLRKQSQISYLKHLSLKFLRFLSGRIRLNQQTTIIEKQIHVYTVINQRSGEIKFNGVIKNSEIEQKIKQSYSAEEIKYNFYPKNQEELQNFQKKSIASIFMHRIKRGSQTEIEKLGVVTTYGLTLTLNENVQEVESNYNNFSFDEQPKHLPDELFQKNYRKASTSLFLRNNPPISNTDDLPNQQIGPGSTQQIQFDSLAESQSKLIYCLGPNNFNFLSNGLGFYYDDKQIQILKFNKQPGNIIESSIQPANTKLINSSSWLVFSTTEITLIKKNQAYEHILAVVDALSHLQRAGIAKGQKPEQYQTYLNNVMEDIQRILGRGQMCEALFKILFAIAREKSGPPTQVSSKGEKIIKISSQAKQAATQQLKFQIKLRNRVRYQMLIDENVSSYFSRWQVPKKKQIKPQTICLSPELQLIIWKYFMIYSIENKDDTGIDLTVFSSPDDKILYNLSAFQMYLVSIFNFHYSIVKNLSLTQFRKSPTKIKEVKIFFNSLLTFLSQKKTKSYALVPNLSTGTNPQAFPFLKNSSSKIMKRDVNAYSWMENTVPFGFIEHGMFLTSPTEEISAEMRKVIPRIISTIQLYELIAGSSQGKYESMPTIQKFMEMTSAKKEVKKVLLDLFNATDVSVEEAIIKFSKWLPELRLDSDIYLANWLKFINKGQINSKQFDYQFSTSVQVRASNIEQLSKKIDIDQTIKIRELFQSNEHLYLQILMNQLKLKKFQLDLVDNLLKNQPVPQNTQSQVETVHTSNVEGSMFEKDKERSNLQKRGWINSEIISIRCQMDNYFQILAEAINTSSVSEYMSREKTFDDCVKLLLQKCEDGKEIVNNLMDFLKRKNILPEKLYRLSVTVNKPLNLGTKLYSNPKKPEMMSSSALIMNNLRKTKQQIFSVLDVTANPENSKTPSSSQKDI